VSVVSNVKIEIESLGLCQLIAVTSFTQFQSYNKKIKFATLRQSFYLRN